MKADVFISLHCNQAYISEAQGVEVFVSIVDGLFLRQSILLGYDIEKTLIAQIGLKSRGVKFENFQVLNEVVGYCPAVLIELGFLSSNEDYQCLTNEERQYKMALVILASISKRIIVW